MVMPTDLFVMLTFLVRAYGTVSREGYGRREQERLRYSLSQDLEAEMRDLLPRMMQMPLSRGEGDGERRVNLLSLQASSSYCTKFTTRFRICERT